MTFSLTLRGLAVVILGTILKAAGAEMPDVELNTFVATGVQIFGAVLVYVGRFRAGDITWYGAKK